MAKSKTLYKLPAIEHLQDKPLRVAAYIREVPDEFNGENVMRANYEHYKNLIGSFTNWAFVGCYAGRGNKSVPEEKKSGYAKLISDCKAGKIDLIIAKSVSVLSRDIQTAIETIREFKDLSPPVGVYFEENNLYTLDNYTGYFLSLFALMAEEESKMKHQRTHPPCADFFDNPLKHARMRKGLTQQEVANKAGVSWSQYQRFETGTREITNASFRITMSVCKALGIVPETLLNNKPKYLTHKKEKET